MMASEVVDSLHGGESTLAAAATQPDLILPCHRPKYIAAFEHFWVIFAVVLEIPSGALRARAVRIIADRLRPKFQRVELRMWSRRLAAIFVIVLIVVPLYFGYFSREDQEIRAFRRGYDRGLLDFRFSATLQTLVRPFVAGTRFEDKVNTNAPPIEGHLNIIVADVETIGRPALKCNCAYLGGDIIACDRVFLETFSKSNDFRSVDPAISPTLNQVDAVFEHWLAAWAIGHEIGHAVLHDKDRSFRRLRLHGDSVAQQLESEADRFFASRVPPDDAQKATFALTSFAFSMISATYAIGENQGGAALIRPSRDAVHAPWLIRVIGVAKAVSQTSSSDGSGDSFYDSLLRNVREDPAGVDIGTFCDMSSLRERAEVAMRSRAQARTRHER